MAKNEVKLHMANSSTLHMARPSHFTEGHAWLEAVEDEAERATEDVACMHARMHDADLHIMHACRSSPR
jgi:hypothetical protein